MTNLSIIKALYSDMQKYAIDNQQNINGITEKFDQMLRECLDEYLYDIDSATREQWLQWLSWNRSSMYSEVDSTFDVTPGMIPLIFAGLCLALDNTIMSNVYAHNLQEWKRFVANYGEIISPKI